MREPGDIFLLAARDASAETPLKDWEGWGETSVKNLFAAIEVRREIPLDRLIYALGIRHIGQGQMPSCWHARIRVSSACPQRWKRRGQATAKPTRTF